MIFVRPFGNILLKLRVSMYIISKVIADLILDTYMKNWLTINNRTTILSVKCICLALNCSFNCRTLLIIHSLLFIVWTTLLHVFVMYLSPFGEQCLYFTSSTLIFLHFLFYISLTTCLTIHCLFYIADIKLLVQYVDCSTCLLISYITYFILFYVV